jgi:ferredoxin-NADP reductase
MPGPTSFVEAVSQILVQSGYPPERVKTERFGAAGNVMVFAKIHDRICMDLLSLAALG